MTPSEQSDFCNRVVARLRAQLGVSFCHQGRSPEEGFDCVGLPAWCLVQEGYEPVNPVAFMKRRYRAWPRPEELREIVESECFSVSGPLLPLDFLVVDLMPPFTAEAARHLMTATSATTVIHTLAKWGGVKEHSYTTEWKMRTSGVWRLKCLKE